MTWGAVKVPFPSANKPFVSRVPGDRMILPQKWHAAGTALHTQVHLKRSNLRRPSFDKYTHQTTATISHFQQRARPFFISPTAVLSGKAHVLFLEGGLSLVFPLSEVLLDQIMLISPEQNT